MSRILRDVPFSGIYWTCYEFLKTRFNVVEPSFGFSFAAGAISGSVAATITTPFEFGEKFIFSDNPPKQVATKSVAARLASIYRLGGVPAVFSGLGPRLLSKGGARVCDHDFIL
ncbi:hypothetical protein KR009_011013 [Drosophila setifemur]|nr:hypothetical protein KR009_011013 [Drosophila setifemur]